MIKSFSDSLESTEIGALTDAVADLTDAGISQLVNNPAVSGIPIVSVLVSLCRTGAAIYERQLLKNTLHFYSLRYLQKQQKERLQLFLRYSR